LGMSSLCLVFNSYTQLSFCSSEYFQNGVLLTAPIGNDLSYERACHN
jgi:hypothetical protein